MHTSSSTHELHLFLLLPLICVILTCPSPFTFINSMLPSKHLFDHQRVKGTGKYHDGKTDLLFINGRGRPYSANKLRAKVLHRLLVQLGIPSGGFHSTRHGVTSALLADGATPATPAVLQKQLRHSDPRITQGVYAHVIGNQQRDAVENRSARIERLNSLAAN